jgi:hypothetical protein
MNRLVTRMAMPPSKRRGLQLAVIAVAMAASLWVVTLWFAVTASAGGYDYAGSNTPLAIASTLFYLAVVPLLFAILALVGRPVRPAGLVPVALLLALCQPVVTVLGVVGLLPGADLGLALLLLVATGSSFGVVAAGLVPVDRRFRAAVMLLIAVGVSVAATAALMVLTSVGMSLIVAILLGVAIAQDRKERAHDALTPEGGPSGGESLTP